MRRLALLLTLGLATPALADDPPEANMSLTEACLAEGKGEACISLAATDCMASEIGGTTYGMVMCLSSELEWWQARQRGSERRAMEHQRQLDADYRQEDGAEGDVGPGEEALRDVLAYGAPWREAQCRLEQVQWWGGSGAGGATLACLVQLTGQHVLRLEAITNDG